MLNHMPAQIKRATVRSRPSEDSIDGSRSFGGHIQCDPQASSFLAVKSQNSHDVFRSRKSQPRRTPRFSMARSCRDVAKSTHNSLSGRVDPPLVSRAAFEVITLPHGISE